MNDKTHKTSLTEIECTSFQFLVHYHMERLRFWGATGTKSGYLEANWVCLNNDFLMLKLKENQFGEYLSATFL